MSEALGSGSDWAHGRLRLRAEQESVGAKRGHGRQGNRQRTRYRRMRVHGFLLCDMDGRASSRYSNRLSRRADLCGKSRESCRGSRGRVELVVGDICDAALMDALASKYDAIVNFAGETDVDRSTTDSGSFLRHTAARATTTPASATVATACPSAPCSRWRTTATFRGI